MSLTQDFLTGFKSPFAGAGWTLAKPSLRGPAAIPVVINILLYALFGWITFHYLGPWIAGWLPAGEGWYWNLLRWILYLVLGFLYLLLIVFTFVGVANIVAGPFNEILSERAERIVTGGCSDAPFRWEEVVKNLAYTVKHESLKLLIFGGCLGAIFLLNIIPVVGNFLYVVLNPLVTLSFLALAYLDVVMSRKKHTLSEKWRMLAAHPAMTLGFGVAVFVFLFIPLANFLLIGGAVVGGTRLYLDRLAPSPPSDLIPPA